MLILHLLRSRWCSRSSRTLTVLALLRKSRWNGERDGPDVVHGAWSKWRSRRKCRWGAEVANVEHAWAGMARSTINMSESVWGKAGEGGMLRVWWLRGRDGTAVGGLDVKWTRMSVTKVEPPKRVLCPQNRGHLELPLWGGEERR